MSTPVPERAPERTPERILALNAVRGLAALLVVVSHLHEYDAYVQLGPALEGSLGVMLFFTLSGFLMGHLYLHRPLDRSSLHGYAVARFSRIAPPYLIVVTSGFLIYQLLDASFPYAITLAKLPRHLLFSGNVSVLWSIPPEVQFYGFFVAIWWGVHRAVSGRGTTALLGVATLGIVMMAARGHVPGTFVASKLQYFAIGVFLGWLNRQLPARGIEPRALLALQLALIATFVLFVSGVISLGEGYWMDVAPALVAGLAIFAFSRECTPLDRALHARWLQRLGDWSFSVYLVHLPLLWALQKTGWFNGSVAGTLIAVVLSVAGSALFSVLVEHPACAATRRLLMRQRAPSSTAAPAALPQASQQ